MQKTTHHEIEEHLFRDESKPSENCRDFLKQCLTVSKKSRPSARELLKHPWIRENAPNKFSLTTADKADIMNRLIAYQKKSDFLKIVTSLAIGLEMDEGNEE